MDKIYTAQDVVNVIKKVEELNIIDAELNELVYRGSNDEKLVSRKFELQNEIRKYKSAVPQPQQVVKDDEETKNLREEFVAILFKYKKRKRELESIIRSYTDGNSN